MLTSLSFRITLYYILVFTSLRLHNYAPISACFDPADQMVNCDPHHGKYMASCLLYWVMLFQNMLLLHFLYQNRAFQTGFKVGINDRKPEIFHNRDLVVVTQSMCMLSKTTACNCWDMGTSRFQTWCYICQESLCTSICQWRYGRKGIQWSMRRCCYSIETLWRSWNWFCYWRIKDTDEY